MLPRDSFSDIQFRTQPRDLVSKRHKSAYVMTFLFLFLVAIGYVVYRSSTLLFLPELALDSPDNGAYILGDTVAIQGISEPETRVTINGYEIFTDKKGKFLANLPLGKGFHIIDVRVKNRVGKESRVVRQIVVE